jgi:leucyl/phenylalanyl-tRNA---protein transferase
VPIFQLDDTLGFPSVSLAEPDGLLAVGGDLSSERIIFAYKSGIFPWYSAGEPILWWSPQPRFVLFPEELKVSESMRRILKSGKFQVTFDKDFPLVIAKCRHVPRRHQKGTWITPEMLKAYRRLHEQGVAHSVEVWREDRLAGGLYGLSLGGLFFGESMFTEVSNASKAGFIELILALRGAGCALVDCQVHTRHLESLGARFISREDYLRILRDNTEQEMKMAWNRRPEVE